MSPSRFSGVLAPVITPFQADLSPDADRLLAHCKWLLGEGVELAVFGTNSEANSLSLKEKKTLLDQLLEGGIDPVSMMPGTGGCALSDAVELSGHAVELGCAGALMLPPFYYKGVSDEGLFAFYSEVIQRVASDNLRIYLYHIPPISQVPISLQLIDRLVKEYPGNIAGIKDSGGEWENTRALNEAGWPDFRVFCGSESFLLQNMQCGGAGCISATANVNPGAIRQLYDNWESPQAKQMQQELDEVRALFQIFPMIPALKAATALFADDDEWRRVRPPLVELGAKQLEELETGMHMAAFSMDGLGA
ncbi:MAG: dihydrodipicolinate synthase family protein [Pseudohongiellaceae bacterium]